MVLNILKKLIDDNIAELNSFCSTIGQVIDGYSNYNFYTWRSTKDKSIFSFFIIPSPTQRLKERLTRIVNSVFSTTWNKNNMAEALLSWMSGTIKPVVLLNTRLWKSDNIVLIYDGESKMHFVSNFIDNKPVFEVLKKCGKGYVFTDAVEEFKSKIKTYENYGSKRIMGMLNEFKKQRHEGGHTEEHLTSDWMIQNGYEDLLEKLKNQKVTVSLEDLDPGVEADVYQTLGSCGAEQSVSQLSMSHVKASLWPYLYHRDGKPDNELSIVFDRMAEDTNNLKFNTHKDLFNQLLGKDPSGYKEWDVYLYNLFTFSFLHVDERSGKLRFVTDVDYDDMLPRFVRWKKKANENGNVLFFKRRADAFNKLDESEKIRLVKNLKEKVIPNLNELLVYISSKKFQAQWRAGNKDKVKGFYKRINDALGVLYGKHNTEKLSGVKSFRNTLHLYRDDVGFNVCLLKTLEYLVCAEALKSASAVEAFKIVMKSYVDHYPKYVFSRQTVNIAKDTDALKASRDYFEDNCPGKTYSSLGSLLAQIGDGSNIGLDTTSKLHSQFIDHISLDKLNEKYGDVLSTTKARRKLMDQWELGGRVLDDFLMMNPHGDIYPIDYADVGHCKQNKDGNELTETNFIVEHRGKNQGIYKNVDKNQVAYYSLADKRVKAELEEAYTDRDTKRIVELDKCQNTLDWLIDYHNIEIDEDIDFDEEGYIVSQKDAA